MKVTGGFAHTGPHESMGPDIGESRRVPVHICDHCGVLFVPLTTPEDEADRLLAMVLAKPED